MKYPPIQNYIAGSFVSASIDTVMPVISPLDGTILSTVPMSAIKDLDQAVEAAKKAFPSWSNTPIKERVQVFFRYKTLLEKNLKMLAELCSEENGKTYSESVAEIEKCIELTEFATSLPQLISGELLEVSKGVECRTEHVPLGVVASIVPFNFPSMVPNWTIPNAIALGNCMIMKPSEKVPLSCGILAQLLKEAGLPDGVFNIVHGDTSIVEAICDHPDIEAISFVGSTKVAKIVYRRATHNYKRCIALGGAKNHLMVLPDAIPDMTAQNVAASMSGCAGQRCMAASAMIGVGNIDPIVSKICDEARKIIPGVNLGAVINQESKERIEKYIAQAEADGAKILVDGRNTVVEGKENGTYVGPTVIDHVRPEMSVATEEIFGPVISIMRTNTVDEALAIENASPYGNAASVFTQNGGMARYIIEHASAGMIGVNVGVPVPREPFSFGGWNESKFGVGDITGKSSIEFWTKLKKSTIKWNAEAGVNWMS
ncbi:MAG: CoA-acylating methylmalonate-semialdehyde dehydrogenase [Saprospiraceae bacterium]|jgi:malonate-semialdehyde dehydrogenase (acetylating) / methylmalonate-semialdehyde dehydrogenase|uniref:CoA-acylating methylmalonate-semialdehyde dehydrogenase n=1 Tax=Candidatus Brachybacter algidus TaxID=2982024 RepID=UPI001B7896C5|nr:CoA-acylating methylmalonate-semialdehyde dehydrogenase [Candidatus Brachybacter algidus]MBP6679588.1 CoA-acylating methylmalonate-semialdehyde dehydrogenase [Saprospiraceae bacterium]MBK6450298.1 CoA-acylating methylmalonate-semialdehyde dehydrogenase [Candidatus Brachybacter algidus]MBK7603122.1 CoA-acylating methylmalonate-semialdehyde dehydrogenase [Candidatus Brachybacter algidus]MBK8356521.1 CoA-acylating methylmalonate-semialdehyde dehydrogenase [Candidatus Brachybacter algidus]MBK88